MPRLSKSQYVRGRRCAKRLYLYYFHRDLMKPPSLFEDGILKQGTEVGELARTLFPHGELIHEGADQPLEALGHTARAIASGRTVLFEAAVEFEDILIRADILVKNDLGAWDLIEVKSSTNHGEPRREYILDLAIQKYVLQGSGLPVGSARLARLRANYRRQASLDLHQLFVMEPMDERITSELESVPAYLRELRAALRAESPPPTKIGTICKGSRPCEFKDHCWKDLPDDSIHYLFSIRDPQREWLLARNIDRMVDIPDGVLTDLRQIRHVESVRHGEALADLPRIRGYLNKLKYPLHFLDFETFGYAVPRFENTFPYQKLAFQFSLHVQKQKSSPYDHHEFLTTDIAQERRLLAERLTQWIAGEGSVIAYHASFEKGVIDELARDFPELSDKLLSISARLWDLEVPFANRWVCRAAFEGKSSIKMVLPGLLPGVNYSHLEIQNGEQAIQGYLDLIRETTPQAEKARLKRALLDYCKLDSWAMVQILEHISTHYAPT